jgi:protein-tyrosine-phosphatase
MSRAPDGVLFLCADGACLGPMAEALMRRGWPGRAALSAAVEPGHLRRVARALLADRGMPTAGLRARGLREVDWEEIAEVIVLNERISLPPLPSRVAVQVWATPDPMSGPPGEHRESCEAALERIEARLRRMLGPPDPRR